jgi:hypothetical protein
MVCSGTPQSPGRRLGLPRWDAGKVQTPVWRPDAAEAKVPTKIEVTVEYLPATKPFHGEFAQSDTAGAVRASATSFFSVADHQDRDKHEFFLEFEGARLTDLGQTLESLLGPHRRGAQFNLIEVITQGRA